MKLLSFRTFLLLFVTLTFMAQFVVWNIHEYKSFSSIKVKVPPARDKNLLPEEIYWRSQKFLFPQIEIPNPAPEGLPYDDSLLWVSLEKDGSIKINSETIGNLENTEILKQRLEQIFAERAELGVFEPNGEKIVKAVSIKAPLTGSYGEAAKVVDAVKASGADPIVLQMDDLPE